MTTNGQRRDPGERDRGARRELAGIGRVELAGVEYSVVLDRKTGRVALAWGATPPREGSAARAATWIGSAQLLATGELELGPALRTHLRAIGESDQIARERLIVLLGARGLRPIRRASLEEEARGAGDPPLRVARWCAHCRSELHDAAAHRAPEAAAHAARAHLEAGDEAGAAAFAALARTLLARAHRPRSDFDRIDRIARRDA